MRHAQISAHGSHPSLPIELEAACEDIGPHLDDSLAVYGLKTPTVDPCDRSRKRKASLQADGELER